MDAIDRQPSICEFQTSTRARAGLDGVYLNVTRACNIRCAHCFIDAGAPALNELSTHDFQRVIAEIAEVGAEKVTLTGGEPLTRSDFCQLLKFASAERRKGIGRLALVTNAMLVDEQTARVIARAVDRVNVSMDGIEAIHDSLRGRGTFKLTLRGLRFLLREGADVTVMTTVTAENVSTLDEFVSFLCDTEGVRHFRFRPLWLLGRASTMSYLQAERSTIFAKLKSVGVQIQEGTCDMDGGGVLGRSLNIHPDGAVYPCHFLHHPEFSAGNVKRMSVGQIYRSPILAALRVANIQCCQELCDARSQLRRLVENAAD